MGILRSERMKHGTLVLPTERARHFMNVVGKLQNCNIQFEDMNSQTMRRPSLVASAEAFRGPLCTTRKQSWQPAGGGRQAAGKLPAACP